MKNDYVIETVGTGTYYVIESSSGARVGGTCVLGEGATKAQAWLDAFGPKPWSPYTKKCAKQAWVRQLENGEEVSYSD